MVLLYRCLLKCLFLAPLLVLSSNIFAQQPLKKNIEQLEEAIAEKKTLVNTAYSKTTNVKVTNENKSNP